MRYSITALLVLLVVLFSSCASHKRIWYLQDGAEYSPEQIQQQGQIRIRPLDRLSIVVNSKNPELAAPFNAATSFNALNASGLTTSYNNSSLQVRTVDNAGNLEMPVLGTIHCQGMTRHELAECIAAKIVEGGYINDPIVNAQFDSFKISVIGEVTRPGVYDIVNDKVTIFDALAMAGDLTIYGQRQDVAVVREKDGVRSVEFLDLTSTELFNSPAFYIDQNDVIYVKPNKYKAESGEISQNRAFYISLISTAIAVATLIVTIAK